MIEIIIGALIGSYIAYKNSFDILWHSEEAIDRINSIFLIVFCGVFGAGLGIALSLIIGGYLPKAWIQDQPTNLAALRDNISTEGSFFLGSGSINGVLEYYYYADLGNNTYASGSINADKADIVEDNPKQPYLAEAHEDLSQDWMKWFAFDPDEGNKTYEFHIPSGSVVRGYNLNLGK